MIKPHNKNSKKFYTVKMFYGLKIFGKKLEAGW